MRIEIAGYRPVQITEFSAHCRIMPVGKENVQITNLGDSSVSLAGFSLTMQDGTQFSLPSTQLNSGDFVNV
jgi:hypothetical protein